MSALAPLAATRAAARLPALGAADRPLPAPAEWLALACAGALATVISAALKVRLGLPGHHIVLVAPALALGLALVPRRLGGSVMSLAAVASALALRFAGAWGGLGAGSLTSTLLLGPCLDFALARIERGRGAAAGRGATGGDAASAGAADGGGTGVGRGASGRGAAGAARATAFAWRERFAVHLAFAGAGLAANLAALAVRAGTKASLPGLLGGGRPLHLWWPQAIASYAACGLAAGLIASALCFRASRGAERAEPPSAGSAP